MSKCGALSVGKVNELKLLPSLARTVADGRNFLDVEVGGVVGEQGERAEVAVKLGADSGRRSYLSRY